MFVAINPQVPRLDRGITVMKDGNPEMLKKGDIILIAAIILATVAGFAAMALYDGSGGHRIAVIRQDNKIIETIDLDKVVQPRRINIKGAYSEVILVEKGRIRFEEADCPNLDCVKTGWISKKGTSAVCLPNRTSISIERGPDDVDGTTF